MGDSVAVINGPTDLPPGFDHAHASEAARQIAQDGMILRVQVGSGVHGTSISGQDDRDEMGICLEPPRFVTGLARVPNGTRAGEETVPFEQYERHAVWDQPGGLATRGGVRLQFGSTVHDPADPAREALLLDLHRTGQKTPFDLVALFGVGRFTVYRIVERAKPDSSTVGGDHDLNPATHRG